MTSAALNPRTKAVPPSRQGRRLRRPPSPLKATRVPARGVFILPPALRQLYNVSTCRRNIHPLQREE
ncbi:hypothetical protein E2C01_090490 [Portunus trituberculatus]|uniref:Uncharacterized protein n=1 Tax=Portunus trituberculatus TaxID=210409 RepID=A0A5B7JQ90_PORTR|nr:hypothetical protein [Portunus trituberculatus]